jgi:hypothetical protein
MPPVIPARALAGAAVSAVALATLAFPGPASADVTVDCTADNTALLTAAETAVADAKATRLAANRPLGLLMQAERRETRAEVRAAREAVKALRAEARDRDLTDEERAALRASLEEQSDALRHALRLLESKRALLAEIKADRAEARAVLADARAALAELRAALEDCEGAEEVEEPVEDPVDDGGDTGTVAIP